MSNVSGMWSGMRRTGAHMPNSREKSGQDPVAPKHPNRSSQKELRAVTDALERAFYYYEADGPDASADAWHTYRPARDEEAAALRKLLEDGALVKVQGQGDCFLLYRKTERSSP